MDWLSLRILGIGNRWVWWVRFLFSCVFVSFVDRLARFVFGPWERGRLARFVFRSFSLPHSRCLKRCQFLHRPVEASFERHFVAVQPPHLVIGAFTLEESQAQAILFALLHAVQLYG